MDDGRDIYYRFNRALNYLKSTYLNYLN